MTRAGLAEAGTPAAPPPCAPSPRGHGHGGRPAAHLEVLVLLVRQRPLGHHEGAQAFAGHVAALEERGRSHAARPARSHGHVLHWLIPPDPHPRGRGGAAGSPAAAPRSRPDPGSLRLPTARRVGRGGTMGTALSPLRERDGPHVCATQTTATRTVQSAVTATEGAGTRSVRPPPFGISDTGGLAPGPGTHFHARPSRPAPSVQGQRPPFPGNGTFL